MKKRCTKCGKHKLATTVYFGARSIATDGLLSHCRTCRYAATATWRKENPNKAKQASLNWYSKPVNRLRAYASTSAWFVRNPTKALELQRSWRTKNRGKHAMSTRAHEAAKLKAMPPWLTKEDKKKIEKIYVKAARLGLTVDHEVPLRGKGICGLHVPWNLRLMTSSANSSKGNKYAQAGPT